MNGVMCVWTGTAGYGGWKTFLHTWLCARRRKGQLLSPSLFFPSFFLFLRAKQRHLFLRRPCDVKLDKEGVGL